MKSLSLSARTATILLAGAALSGCSSKPVVGVLLPMSGAASTYGESMKQGIELALDQARADGSLGANVEFLWGDSATDPTTAVAELERLAGDGVKIAIIGTTSGTAKALLPALERTNTLALSPSASAPDLTKDSKLFFRVFASDELEGRRAGRFLREEQDDATVLLFAEDSEQARGIEPPFRQVFEQAMEGRVIGKVSLSSDGWQEESSDLLAIHNPDAVYIIGYADRSIAAVRHLRDKNFDGTICLTSAFYSSEVTDQNPDVLEGVFFPQPAFDMQDERDLVQNFVTSFRDAWGHDPDIYAAHAFDAARVVIHVVNEASAYDTTDLRRGLQFSVKEFPGVTGIIQFNDFGDVHHNPIMFTIRDGKVVNYERFIKEQKKLIRERIRNLLKGK